MRHEFDRKLLDIISSRNQEIYSLSIQEARGLRSYVGALNMSTLWRLQFSGMRWKDALEIMDIVLNKGTEALELNIITEEIVTDDFLKHGLLQRVKYLMFVCGKYIVHWLFPTDNCYLGESEPSLTAVVALPLLKQLNIIGSDSLLNSFEIKEVEILEFCCATEGRSFLLTSSPAQLTELSLENVDFTAMNVSRHLPYDFPCLRKLRLFCVDLEAPLQKYFKMPRLQRLDLDEVNVPSWDYENTHNLEDESNLSDKSPSFLFLSQQFHELEVLLVDYNVADAGFVKRIQNYPQLCNLEVYLYDSRKFLSKFVESLEHKGAFPSLKLLDISAFKWPSQWTSMSYTEFVQYCTAKRPGLNVAYIDKSRENA
jgi:hypothetical protein